MAHLFIVSVGPVQEFIASARRSRDLWFGSWLLSELSKAAALAITKVTPEEGDYGLIFPHPCADLQPGSSFNVANKIVALIAQSPTEVGNEVRTMVLARLREIRNTAFGSINSPYFLKATGEAQVEDLLELYWVTIPLRDLQGGNSYVPARTQAEALLAARKSTRDFDPVSWGASVPKSSLDGLRESVIDKGAYQLGEKQLFDYFGIRPGEELCGVGLLKRRGNRGNQDGFYSTSHVAALPLLQRITANAKLAAQQYVEKLQLLGLAAEARKPPQGWTHPAFSKDGQLLFAERLAEFLDKNECKKVQEARNALAEFLKSAADKRAPLPYYALLHADGDFMGKAIDAQNTPKAHRNLSQKLAEFAQIVEAIVEENHSGALVYSGGDDVLAFLPLHTVLACARELADTFREQLAEFKSQDQISPTLSVGVVIAHHIEPLSDALQLVRDAEKKAKQVAGKNALAVTLSKRGGVDRTVSDSWNKLDQRLNLFIALHRMEAIPDGVAYELEQLSQDLAHIPEAIIKETERILKRKRAKRGQEKIQQGIVEKILTSVRADNRSIKELAEELMIASYFAQATEQADIALEALPGYQMVNVAQEQKP
ncbi:MAG: type III-B CRISPR-associated protein Cas10/Cmr2 [Caldilineaceae bacterium]|nr:type III-B CRISPR-associated protein Cas10/Cmr2 [Caldilineaceae bacterium]